MPYACVDFPASIMLVASAVGMAWTPYFTLKGAKLQCRPFSSSLLTELFLPAARVVRA